MSADVSPVNHERPDDRRRQDLVSFEGGAAPVKEERKVGADHDGEPLSEVPVPGMRAVEISHAVEDVELQEVELHHGPLKTRERNCHGRLYRQQIASFKNRFNVLPFHRIYSRSLLKSQQPKLWKRGREGLRTKDKRMKYRFSEGG